MPKINVLPKEISELIAAGEVVERPSSVLKELIENSIDSGATEIVAEIKHGGVALIRVSDNGCGIEKDDLIDSIIVKTQGFVSGNFSENDEAPIQKFREFLDLYKGIDKAKRIVVLMNGSREAVKFNIPAGNYKWITDGSTWDMNGKGALNASEVKVPAITGVILAEF